MKIYDRIMSALSVVLLWIMYCVLSASFMIAAFPNIKIKMFPLTMAIMMLIGGIKYGFDNFPLNKKRR